MSPVGIWGLLLLYFSLHSTLNQNILASTNQLHRDQQHAYAETGTIKIFVAWLAITWGGSHMNWLSRMRRPFRMYTGPTAHICVQSPALGQPLGERGLDELKMSWI